MTTAADDPGQGNAAVSGMAGDLSATSPGFSMRRLTVPAAELISDTAAAASLRAAGVCGVCGVDGDQYLAWQQCRDRAREAFELLSRREQEIAGLAAAGLSSRDCADRLRISVKTVEKHRLSAYRRLRVPGLAGLIRIFLETGFPIPPASAFLEHGADDSV